MKRFFHSNRVFRASFFSLQTGISALSLVFWAAAIQPGSAQVLLNINDSNPSNVVITATSADAGVNYNGNNANQGVDLLQFFTQNEFNMTFGQNLSGGLTGGNTGVNYNDLYSDDQSTGNTDYLDMELYVDLNSAGEANTETFSTTRAAFSGTWTVDLAALGVTGAALPTAGTQGNIISGYSGGPGAVIGQWSVEAVPEPGATSLAMTGLAVTGIWMFCQRGKGGKCQSIG